MKSGLFSEAHRILFFRWILPPRKSQSPFGISLLSAVSHPIHSGRPSAPSNRFGAYPARFFLSRDLPEFRERGRSSGCWTRSGPRGLFGFGRGFWNSRHLFRERARPPDSVLHGDGERPSVCLSSRHFQSRPSVSETVSAPRIGYGGFTGTLACTGLPEPEAFANTHEEDSCKRHRSQSARR